LPTFINFRTKEFRSHHKEDCVLHVHAHAYVSLMNGVKPTDELKTALVKLVRSEIGARAMLSNKD
jgi:acyl-coenzyme A synthetase/AMP-(fatty) acid ligase